MTLTIKKKVLHDMTLIPFKILSSQRNFQNVFPGFHLCLHLIYMHLNSLCKDVNKGEKIQKKIRDCLSESHVKDISSALTAVVRGG